MRLWHCNLFEQKNFLAVRSLQETINEMSHFSRFEKQQFFKTPLFSVKRVESTTTLSEECSAITFVTTTISNTKSSQQTANNILEKFSQQKQIG